MDSSMHPVLPGSAPPASPCTDCNGDGGRTEDTSGGGTTRKTWRTCQTCRGGAR